MPGIAQAQAASGEAATFTGNKTITGTLTVQGTYVAIGTNPASTGVLRIPNANQIAARNAANNADVNIVNVTAGNVVAFDSGAAGATFGGTLGVTGLLTANAAGANQVGSVTFNAGAVSGVTTLAHSSTITGTLGTVAANTPFYSGTATWNNAGVTFQGILLNVTNTASGASSTLIDLQVGAASQFKVTKGGAGTFAGALTVSAGGAAITGNSSVTGTFTVTYGNTVLGANTVLIDGSTATARTIVDIKGAGGAATQPELDLHYGATLSTQIVGNNLTTTITAAPNVAGGELHLGTNSGDWFITYNSGGVVIGGNIADPGAIVSVQEAMTVNVAADNFIRYTRAAGNNRLQAWYSGAVLAANLRWDFGVNSTLEGGANAGSDFILRSYSDAGAAISTVLSITRSTGLITTSGAVTLGGLLTANVAGANVVGGVTMNAGAVSGVTTLAHSRTITGTLGTITASTPAYSSTATWNAGLVTFTHIFANITDTASAAGSLLMDLQKGAVSQFNVNKSGNVTGTGTLNFTSASAHTIGSVTVTGGALASVTTLTASGAIGSTTRLFAGTDNSNAFLNVQGNMPGVGSGQTNGVGLTLTLADAVATATCFSSYPTNNHAGTVTNFYHVWIRGGTNTAGTVTTSYSLYCEAPAFGTSAYAAYFGGTVGINTATPKTTLSVNGGVSVGIAYKSANYIMTTSDYVIRADAGTGAITITLPAASNAGMMVTIVKIDNSVNAVTVSRAGADTIEGATSKSLAAQYNKVTLVADGTATWYDLDTGLI